MLASGLIDAGVRRMRRWALLGVCALTTAGGAAAIEYDHHSWRRVDTDYGHLWVDAGDLDRQAGAARNMRSLTVLSPWPNDHTPHVGEGVAWTVSEITFSCNDGGVMELTRHYAADGRFMADRDLPEEIIDLRSPLGVLFQAACEGAPIREGVRLGSVREVIAHEQAGDGPAEFTGASDDSRTDQPESETQPVEKTPGT